MTRWGTIMRSALALALIGASCAAPGTTDSPSVSSAVRGTPSPGASAPSTAATPQATEQPSGDALLALPLVDVRTGETFLLGELAAEKPVVIEAMAIWCANCRAQQREVVRAHDLADFHSVGIDVDPNERPGDLAEYAEREGFDWRFVMADAQLVDLLADRFGFAVTNPPSMPTFVASGAAMRALEFGRLRSAEELVAELSSG